VNDICIIFPSEQQAYEKAKKYDEDPICCPTLATIESPEHSRNLPGTSNTSYEREGGARCEDRRSFRRPSAKSESGLISGGGCARCVSSSQSVISADLCESKVSSSTSTPRHTHTASYGRADCEPAGPELEARIPISVHLLLEIEHKPRHTTTPTQKRNREIKKK
jgi:hypothetical protein